jgi:hypothetical protein
VDLITALVNAGSAGAVIVVVILFLRYMEKRDAQWREWMVAVRAGDQQMIDGLKDAIRAMKEELAALRADFQSHTTEEMQRFDLLLKRRNSRGD